MFETAELGRSVGKEEFEAEVPKLRLGLLEAQRELQKAGVPVIVLLAGADGAGKGETVKRVLEWLDARGLDSSRLRRPHRRGAGAAPVVALLDEPAPPGPHRHLLRLLVLRASRGAGLRAVEPGPLRPDAVRGRLLRADARGGRGAGRQALDPPLEEGAPQAPPPPRGRPRHALEGVEGRLEALPEVRPLHRGLRARDPADRHEPGAVAPGRGHGRALPRPHGRAHAAGALPQPPRAPPRPRAGPRPPRAARLRRRP